MPSDAPTLSGVDTAAQRRVVVVAGADTALECGWPMVACADWGEVARCLADGPAAVVVAVEWLEEGGIDALAAVLAGSHTPPPVLLLADPAAPWPPAGWPAMLPQPLLLPRPLSPTGRARRWSWP